MLTSKTIKDFAKKCGADLVGIGNIDRFDGAPKMWDPRYILPEAKSIIGLGFRIHRGLLRGYEEGTYMGSYPSMGYANINDVYGPIVLRELGSFIEDTGHEAIIFNNTAIRYGFQMGQAVSPDKPRPDVFLHFRISGLICGMGEIGYSHIFLTPEFGPRQRLAFIVTDAELEPDPIFEGGLCDRCKLCVKECPAHAISRDETTTYTVAGKTYTQAMLDEFRCSAVFQAGSPEYNPFGTSETDEVISEIIENGSKCYARKTKPGFFSKGVQEDGKQYWDGGTIHDWLAEKISFIGTGVKNFNHPGAICGARGCIRACMMHLESQGKLKNKFELPFRIRKPWKLDPENRREGK
jgi:ferredoxin